MPTDTEEEGPRPLTVGHSIRRPPTSKDDDTKPRLSQPQVQYLLFISVHRNTNSKGDVVSKSDVVPLTGTTPLRDLLYIPPGTTVLWGSVTLFTPPLRPRRTRYSLDSLPSLLRERSSRTTCEVDFVGESFTSPVGRCEDRNVSDSGHGGQNRRVVRVHSRKFPIHCVSRVSPRRKRFRGSRLRWNVRSGWAVHPSSPDLRPSKTPTMVRGVSLSGSRLSGRGRETPGDKEHR